MDFQSIIDAISPVAAALTILGAAALYAQIKFCLWAAPKVARFFVLRRLR